MIEWFLVFCAETAAYLSEYRPCLWVVESDVEAYRLQHLRQPFVGGVVDVFVLVVHFSSFSKAIPSFFIASLTSFIVPPIQAM